MIYLNSRNDVSPVLRRISMQINDSKWGELGPWVWCVAGGLLVTLSTVGLADDKQSRKIESPQPACDGAR